ncbi:MAG TPA: retroviral-like aspartic protease family protein [Brevundimonas sp.]
MRRRDLLFRLGLIGATVAGGWWFRDNVLWRKPDIFLPTEPEWLPFAERRASVPTVEVLLGDRPIRALIDSGAQYSVIDRALLAEIGAPETFDMPIVAYGVGGQAQVGKGVTLDVTVGATKVSHLRTAILALGPLASKAGLGTSLILGQDVLGELMLDLDVERRRLRFLPANAGSGAAGWPDNVAAVDVRRERGALKTTVTVEGATVEAVIDTGSSAIIALSRSTATAAGLLDERERRDGTSIVLGGSMASTIVQARTMTFADQLYERAEAAVYADVALPGFPDALVGMAAFAGRRAVLDLGGGRMWASRQLDLTVGR